MRRVAFFLVWVASTTLFACHETRPVVSPAAPSPTVRPGEDGSAPDIRGYLSRVLRWALAPCGAGQSCETWNGLGDKKPLDPDDGLYRKHAHLFSRGCGLSGEPAPAVPLGKLVPWDIDGDGRSELVFAGGCSPEPYFVILTGGPDVFTKWREFSGRLLGIEVDDGRLILAASREGYGVERDSGLIFWDCLPGAPERCTEIAFRWAKELSGDLPVRAIRPCAVVRDSALRTSPAIDDTPEESGMGFDWPGNLYQTLAAGSEGWALAEVKDKEGRAWSLLAFGAPPAAEDLIASVLRPFLARRPGTPAAGGRAEWMLGWLPSETLGCAPALNP